MKNETLTLAADEVRFANDEAGTFSGYASIFGEPDSYGDQIRPGAFAKTINQRKGAGPVAMFWNHNPDEPIGVWTTLAEDTRGLKATGQLVTATTRGADTLALLKAGAISGLSIGFRAIASERGANGGRVLTQIELVEISVVSLPAASKARITSVKGAGNHAGAAAFVQAIRHATATIQRSVR